MAGRHASDSAAAPVRHVALLRAISNVSMQPFRAALEALGLAEVASFGMSGNLIFSAPPTPAATLERRIGARLDKVAIVRTAAEMAATAAADPFSPADGAAVLFLAAAPPAAKIAALEALDFDGDRAVVAGKAVYFIHPLRLRGRKGPFDLEGSLGLGTARSARVVRRLAELMAG